MAKRKIKSQTFDKKTAMAQIQKYAEMLKSVSQIEQDKQIDLLFQKRKSKRRTRNLNANGMLTKTSL